MKEIVVISGKGGTGKTSLTASFAYLSGKDIVAADCDVDAADMHLLLKPDFAERHDFYSGELAVIDQSLCTSCGACAEVCRFDSFIITDGNFFVDPLSCEGCGYCARVCPSDAITMKEQQAGEWYVSATKTGGPLVHARLHIGAENSGKLVAKVKNEAKRIASETDRDIVLVDGSPGIGCPVVSSLSGADFVVLVTEPTVSGHHDLMRVHKLVRKFNIQAGCIINKADLNPAVAEAIMADLEKENIIHLGNLPYDENFTRAMTEGKTIVEYEESKLADLVSAYWREIININFDKEKRR